MCEINKNRLQFVIIDWKKRKFRSPCSFTLKNSNNIMVNFYYNIKWAGHRRLYCSQDRNGKIIYYFLVFPSAHEQKTNGSWRLLCYWSQVKLNGLSSPHSFNSSWRFSWSWVWLFPKLSSGLKCFVKSNVVDFKESTRNVVAQKCFFLTC